MNISKAKLMAIAMTLVIPLAACDKPNSAEKAGSEAGREIDRATEKAGEKLNQAAINLNEKTVKASAVIEDATLTTMTKTAILAEPGLKVLKINVDTVGGVVTLTGTVDSQANSDKALQLASSVSGVKQVVNQLSVVPEK